MAHDDLRIVEDLLSRQAGAIAQKDRDAFLGCYALPVRFETFDDRRELRHERELAHLFASLVAHNVRVGVTDIVRRVLAVSRQPDGALLATHEMRLITYGNVLHCGPFLAMYRYELLGDGWRITSCQHAVTGDAPAAPYHLPPMPSLPCAEGRRAA